MTRLFQTPLHSNNQMTYQNAKADTKKIQVAENHDTHIIDSTGRKIHKMNLRTWQK